MSEIRTIVRQQHKNDLAEEISILMNIFVDFDRLSQDLIAAGSISTRKQLDMFFKALIAEHPLLSVVDCGSNQGAVPAKMQGMESNSLHGKY